MKTLNEYVDGLRLLMRQNKFNKVVGYANFLKQPLQLGFFIPCDKDGKPLSEPYLIEGNEQYYGAEMDEYQQACDRVLFEGFEYKMYESGYFSIYSKRLGVIYTSRDNKFSYKTIDDLSGKVDLVKKVAEQFKY